MRVDNAVAKPHQSGYGASAAPAAGCTDAALRARSVLLAASAAAATAAVPSRR